MGKMGREMKWVFRVGWFGIAAVLLLVSLFLLRSPSLKSPVRRILLRASGEEPTPPPGEEPTPPPGEEPIPPPGEEPTPPPGEEPTPPPGEEPIPPPGEEPTPPPLVRLHVEDHKVEIDNGLVQVTLSSPGGFVTGIRYNGMENVLEYLNYEDNRGYWDIVWNRPGLPSYSDRIGGTSFNVIKQDNDQVEVSFTTKWNSSFDRSIPLNIDKRFIMLAGSSGFYSYAIYERLEGWPELNIDQTRIVFKLHEYKFQYMAVSDDRQRIMPLPEDRATGEPLSYPEAVLLKNATNRGIRGEVDDKYQYSCDNKDNQVHGWISFDPPVGFWMITPSNEFRTAGPVKQDLTSHVGPITLAMFASTHYAGRVLSIKFQEGEQWKKVFGPVFVHLNSVPFDDNPLELWNRAKTQMMNETENWPYDFPQSDDYPSSNQRGTVSGQLLVCDRYINEECVPAGSAHVGLAPPGDHGSWQIENKGYQFWIQADNEGNFIIKAIRSGNYNLYGWVPGVIGDYKYNANVIITPGSEIELGALKYYPPRNGPTLWEIGIPDRTAAEFYIPDPNPMLVNRLYLEQDRFRQYGLWDRYTDLYPDHDLIYAVGTSDYRQDWFYAQVTRKSTNDTYEATTWQIVFELQNVPLYGTYKLRVALASATVSDLQVLINNPSAPFPYFATGVIGVDNAVARHGIHGLYRLYSINITSPLLHKGNNSIFLRQASGSSPFHGIMYDYIRLEGPGEVD